MGFSIEGLPHDFSFFWKDNQRNDSFGQSLGANFGAKQISLDAESLKSWYFQYPETIRTSDLSFRKAALYPTELRGHVDWVLPPASSPIRYRRSTKRMLRLRFRIGSFRHFTVDLPGVPPALPNRMRNQPAETLSIGRVLGSHPIPARIQGVPLSLQGSPWKRLNRSIVAIF